MRDILLAALAALSLNVLAVRAQQAMPVADEPALTEAIRERAMISRTTLTRVERGDAGVSMGIYATVLFVLGVGERIGELADPRTDDVGRALETARLPRRVRPPRQRRARGPA